MEVCSVYNYQGLAPNCAAMLKKVKAVLMTNKGVTQSKTEFIGLSANKTIVADSGGATGIVLDFSRGYERTTDDPEITTSNLNRKEKTMDPNPSMRGYANIAMCDYKTLYEADGKSFDFMLILNDGLKMGTNQSDGTIKGFRGSLNVRFDLPPQDNAQQSYPVDIYFEDYTEFKDFHVNNMSFKLTELKDAVPVGIGLSLNTAYSAGDVILEGKKRCSDELYSGFSATDSWTVIESNAADVDVTAVSVSNGLYTITVQKNASGTPASLSAGEYAVIQGQLDDGSFITYVSDTFKVEA